MSSKNFNQSEISFFDYLEPLEVSASLRFDIQDNLMRLNSDDWISNENPHFKIEFIPKMKIVIIKSQLYKINILEPVEFLGYTSVFYSKDRKTVAIYYPNLFVHYYQTDFFDFDVYYTLAKSNFKEL